jgi:hypothetical protein
MQLELTERANLFSAGYLLDMKAEAFGSFRSSQGVDVPSKLASRMEEDGYLFFPNFLDREVVLNVRRLVTDRLRALGALDPDSLSLEAKALPGFVPTFGPEALTSNNPALDQMLHAGKVIDFFGNFLGGPPRYFEYSWFRTIFPGRGTRPHSDIVYMGRGSRNIFTTWIPIGDIPLQTGGLMILEGSHRKLELTSYLQRDVDEYCTNYPDAEDIASGKKSWQWDGAVSNDPVALRQQLGARWLTTEFKAGDVVIFSAQTVHGSLDNSSEKIRLSVDCRYQLASEPFDERWVGPNPIARGVVAKRGRIC